MFVQPIGPNGAPSNGHEIIRRFHESVTPQLPYSPPTNCPGPLTTRRVEEQLAAVAEVKMEDNPVGAPFGLHLQRLMKHLERRLPIIVALGTDYWLVHSLNERNQWVLSDSKGKYRPMNTSDFQREWRKSRGLLVAPTSLKRSVVSRYHWRQLLPQERLQPNEDLRKAMNKRRSPPKLDVAWNRLRGLRYEVAVNREDLEIVGKMLMAVRHKFYWDVIVYAGEVCAYSLYLHELVRAGWFLTREPPINPCTCNTKITGREEPLEHALSLIVEHKLLQFLSGGKYTIKELVLANPLAGETTENARDWNMIEEFDTLYGRPFLERDDYDERPGHRVEACLWLLAQGFQKV